MRDYNKEYKDNSRKYSYDFDNILRNFMMRSFLPFIHKEENGLEMGCYKGDFTEILVRHFKNLTVIEASDELAKLTQIRVGKNVKFIHSVFETLELTKKYDNIFLLHTLEHLDDPILVLKKINGWLSEKGRLFVCVPNANAPSRQIAVKMGLIDFNSAITNAEKEHGHRKTYSIDTLEKDAVDAGLNIIYRGGVFFKALANFQFDKLRETDIITDEYLEGCYKLGMIYPDLCASIYLVCKKGK